ncbi:hypothetical protein HYV30_01340 [Candidatus Kaiserbacteria bacterium]|nr:hypothetical protein [Candidatus Kaiserbacteria bacterium]
MYDPSKPYKRKILRLNKSTWQTPYVSIRAGTYPVITKKFKGPEVHHSDGIGTKGVYHWRKRSFKNAVIDAFAMNANDIAMAGAIPYGLQDHIVVPEVGERAILEIIRALTALCRKYKVAITGGETSHHDNVEALDIGIVMASFLPKPRTNRFKRGDVLIGLESSGLHSNGFTKVRGLFGKNEWRADFIRPTSIYLDTIRGFLKKYEIHGMMHITGGAFTKLKDLLKDADAIISHPSKLQPHAIFRELFERGVSDKQMYTTFNCGIGFVLSVPEREAAEIIMKTRNAAVIGKIVSGNGLVRIQSAFTGKTVIIL